MASFCSPLSFPARLMKPGRGRPSPHDTLEATEALGADDLNDEEAKMRKIRSALGTALVIGKQHENVEVLRRKPGNPLHSVRSFEELHLPEPLLHGLYDMNFAAPSKIQETALPILLANPPQNMIAQSQSGTGKTAAFLLSALFRVNSSLNYPQVLILSPTYELALQTGEVAKRLAKHRPDITFAFALRGEIISREPIRDHVVFGTPGKVLDWGLRNRRFDLKQITVFVLDEADVMINIQGHRQQSLMIRKALSTNCQMLLFSATYDTEVMEFAETIIPDPVIIRLKRFEETLKNIGQYYVKCTSELEKYTALRNLFAVLSMGQAFIFCETKRSAHWLCERLKSDGHAVGVISGDLTVEERNAVIFKFREGMERVLIATNVVARGIDVDQVTIVVNYDLPVCHETREVDYDTYLHRIGRSGRFGKSGLAVNLIDGPQTLAMIKKLNDHFGIEIQPLDASDADEIERISAD